MLSSNILLVTDPRDHDHDLLCLLTPATMTMTLVKTDLCLVAGHVPQHGPSIGVLWRRGRGRQMARRCALPFTAQVLQNMVCVVAKIWQVCCACVAILCLARLSFSPFPIGNDVTNEDFQSNLKDFIKRQHL